MCFETISRVSGLPPKKSGIIAQEYIQDMYSAAMPVSLDNRLFGLERKINQIANAVETTTHYVYKVSVL